MHFHTFPKFLTLSKTVNLNLFHLRLFGQGILTWAAKETDDGALDGKWVDEGCQGKAWSSCQCMSCLLDKRIELENGLRMAGQVRRWVVRAYAVLLAAVEIS